MAEADLQRLVYERLCWEPGVLVFRFNCGKLAGGGHYQAVTWGAGRLNSGVADLGVMFPGGKMIWLELKTGTKQSQNQVEFERVVKHLGCEYYVIRSLDDVETILEQLRSDDYDKFSTSG